MLFLFKQKTAYEMRISDWSSDVCSSDLAQGETYRGTANLTLDSGHIDIEGDAGTAPRLHWDARATLDGFDPGFFVDGWTGAVDANIASKGGAREDDGYDATVDIPHIGGQLRGRALAGHAHAERKALASSTVQPVYSGEVALRPGNRRLHPDGRGAKVTATPPPR